ncbi:IS30 family transposase [Xanthomonas theicola]|nr:IS30 family transposase [Xanthomonas theicola]
MTHAPWRRGSNGNTNGLLRQFLPKGLDVPQASQDDLNRVARPMNRRPRKTVDGATPAQEILLFKSRVALDR